MSATLIAGTDARGVGAGVGRLVPPTSLRASASRRSRSASSCETPGGSGPDEETAGMDEVDGRAPGGTGIDGLDERTPGGTGIDGVDGRAAGDTGLDGTGLDGRAAGVEGATNAATA